MAYNSYSGNKLPANSSRVNIEPDENRNTDFDREGTQLDTQGNIVSTAPPSFNETGQIKFRRDIYSPVAFKQKVDTSFSELNNQSQIDIPTFFREYNRLFFDIPKQGANSHETIINESRAYFQNYQDPKDATIAGLNTQINELNNKILELELEILSGTGSLDLEALENQAEYGDPTNPFINWEGSFDQNGLQNVFKRVYNLSRGPGSLKFETEFFKSNGDPIFIDLESNQRTTSKKWDDDNNPQIKKNIGQAYRKARSSNQQRAKTRTYSDWREDIIKESSGESKRDALKMLAYLAAKITNKPDFYL